MVVVSPAWAVVTPLIAVIALVARPVPVAFKFQRTAFQESSKYANLSEMEK